METTKLTLITIGLLVAQALLWLTLCPFRLSVWAFNRLSVSSVSFSQWLRVNVALLVLPVAKAHSKIAEASEVGVLAIIEKTYGE